jgi:transposase
MRGEQSEPEPVFSYITPAQRVPQDHPLRVIRTMVDEVLKRLWSDFEKLYSHTGRPSIPPERLLRALLLQVLYSIRSERMLMEQLNYNLLFRWFVGLSMDDRIWDASVFTKNRDRLLRGHIAVLFFEQVLAEARERGLTSDEHFTVDGTLVEAWASLKSFKRKDGSDGKTPPDDPGNPTVNFHGEKRSNDTHQSTTDPDARLATKGNGQEAKLFFMGPRGHGEPQRAGGGRATDARHRKGGTGGGARASGRDPAPTPDHPGRRQRLRRGGICERVAAAQRGTARRQEGPLQRD